MTAAPHHMVRLLEQQINEMHIAISVLSKHLSYWRERLAAQPQKEKEDDLRANSRGKSGNSARPMG